MINKKFILFSLILTVAAVVACAVKGESPNAGTQSEGSSIRANTAVSQPTATPLPAPARFQPAQGAVETVPMPIIPAIIEFEYAPKYFIQWITESPKYSAIEGIIVQSSPPVYQVVLSEKDGKRRVYYSNSEDQVKILSSEGKTARTTPIEFRVTERVGEEPIHEFAFREEGGQAIRWKFIPASELSERGGGAAPGRRKGLSFIYRKLGTAAGEGTAIQIGEAVINAAPWPQISTPPYFVAYRGAYSTESFFGGVVVGTESWELKSAPTAFKEGEAWTLVDSRNNKREFRIVSRKGDELTINETGRGTTLSLTARLTTQGLALRAISTRAADRFINVTFKPELNFSAAPAGEVGFQVDLSGGVKAMEGNITVTKAGNTVDLKWQPRSPNWAKQFVISSSIAIDAKGYKLEVR